MRYEGVVRKASLGRGGALGAEIGRSHRARVSGEWSPGRGPSMATDPERGTH